MIFRGIISTSGGRKGKFIDLLPLNRDLYVILRAKEDLMNKPIRFLDEILQNRILAHSLFWLAVLFEAPLLSELGGEDAWNAFIYRAVGMPIKIIATYVLVYYQIPRFVQQKKYFQFILSFLLSLYVFAVIYRINNVYIAEPWAGDVDYQESVWEIMSSVPFTSISYFIRVYFFSIVFLFIKMVKNRAEEKNQLDVLQKEKALTELNFLKAQIHPHFLFNTLNNLYALTLQKSDKAPEVVEKLSEMLDYMLYQGNEDKVPIQKEIDLIQNFIDLEMLRYGDRLDLSFEQEVENESAEISPLVLLSIVENAFKHGVSGALERPMIDIKLEVKDQRLYVRVFNSKPPIAQTDQLNYKGGIGAKNIQRQLELIYPGRYSWQVEEKEESYEVQLSIAL